MLVQFFLELAFLFLERFPKGQWMGDAMKGFSCSAGSNDGDGPISDETAEKRLIDIYRFNFVKIEFQDPPGDPTHFHDDALIRDGKFAGPIINQWKKSHRQQGPPGYEQNPVRLRLIDYRVPAD